MDNCQQRYMNQNKHWCIYLLSIIAMTVSSVAYSADSSVKKPHQLSAEESTSGKITTESSYQPMGHSVDVQKLMSHEDEFSRLDLNHDGVISQNEAKSEYALRDSFSSVDDDANNEISVHEFKGYYQLRYGSIANTRPLKHLGEGENSTQTFSYYDANGDGSISIKEFSRKTGKGSDGVPDSNQKKPSGAALKENQYDPDPK
tara:strand:- start:967 stop:1572 length:606 start_codon:yes stop_codon:yes gene_type:complete